MTDKERLDEIEKTMYQLQLDLVKLNIDVHMLKLINKILSEVNK
jgi:hypothetical protein